MIQALALALLANVAYLAASKGPPQQEWHYVTSGAALCWAALLLLRQAKNPYAAVGFAWLAWEQAQVAVCGIGSYGLQVPSNFSGLCAVQYGRGAYLIGSAVVVIAAFVYIGRRSRGNRQT